VRLGDISEIIDPHPSHRAPKEEVDGYPFVGIGDISENGDIDLDKCRKISLESVKEQNQSVCIREGDIGFGRVATVGKVVRFKRYDFPFALSPTMALVRHKNVDNTFLYQYLSSEMTSKQFSNLTSGSTRISLGIQNLRKILFALPPLPEQQKIAAILTSVDKKIEVIDERIARAEALKKGLMQKLLSEGIGHTEFKESEIGRIPKEWEVVRLGDIADVKGGKRLPKGHKLVETHTPYPYIRVRDMYMGGIKTDDIIYVPEEVQPKIKNYTIAKDDLFISVAGTLGLVGVVPDELDGANLTENADKLTNIKSDKIFLLYVLMSNLIQDIIVKETTTNAQPKLALTRIKTFLIPLPPINEQKQIATILSTTDNKLDTLREKKSRYEKLKKGLMQKLLTGEVRVKV